MTSEAIKLIVTATVNDYLRDRKTPFPAGVRQIRDLSYGMHRKWNILDVYYPEGTCAPLPTIVNFHGGGWVYGSKEIYRRYCMDLARRGFAVVNFNYRLAPKWKFPVPLQDANAVMEWVCAHADTYYLEPENIFLTGDSAGAQLACQYAAIAANPRYAALFDMTVPPTAIRALGLNCGLYDIQPTDEHPARSVLLDYLGKHVDPADERLNIFAAIGSNYPPAYITTAANDFLRSAAQPMCRFLTDKGIPAQWKCYGTEDQTDVAHVFHVNIRLPEATACNDDTCAFFRKYAK